MDRFLKYLAGAASFAAVCGIPMYLFNKYEENNIRRTMTSIEIIKLGTSGDFKPSIDYIGNSWAKYDISALAERDLSATFRDRLVFQVSEVRPDYLGHVENLSRYYLLVESCVSIGVCDLSTLKVASGSDFLNFYCLHQEILKIIYKKKNYDGAFKRLKALADHFGSCGQQS